MTKNSKCKSGILQAKNALKISLKLIIKEQLAQYSLTLLLTHHPSTMSKDGSTKFKTTLLTASAAYWLVQKRIYNKIEESLSKRVKNQLKSSIFHLWKQVPKLGTKSKKRSKNCSQKLSKSTTHKVFFQASPNEKTFQKEVCRIQSQKNHAIADFDIKCTLLTYQQLFILQKIGLYKIIMQNKGSVLLYHDRILDNIKELDVRKNRHIEYRIEFLKNYCKPIEHKIQETKAQIKHYKAIFQNQTDRIENEKDIKLLKSQIAQYEQTRQYFHDHLSAYEVQMDELRNRNQKYSDWIQLAKLQIQKLSKDEYENYEMLLKEGAQGYFSGRRKKKSVFPPILKPKKDYRNILIDKMRKKAELSMQEYQTELSRSHLRQQTNKAKITHFDELQSLFKEFFEKKKAYIQKSVSQLQSKLIVNKEIFLKACEAIGQRASTLSVEQFIQLTPDQIVTLFISFGWLNRRIYSEFINKRKQILKLLKYNNQS